MKPRKGLSACAARVEKQLAENHLKWILCAGTIETAATDCAKCTLSASVLVPL